MKTHMIFLGLIALALSACDGRSPNELRQGDIRLERFSSCEDLQSALLVERSEWYGNSRHADSTLSPNPVPAVDESSGDNGEGASPEGETNNQVAGVDELDRAKASGDFIYRRQNDEIIVLRRSPSDSAGVIQKIALDFGGYEGGLFLTNTHLISVSGGGSIGIHFFKRDEDGTLTLESEREVDGRLEGARMIGNRIHLVSNQTLPTRYLENGQEKPKLDVVEEALPKTRSGESEEPLSGCTDIFYEPAIHTAGVPSYQGDVMEYFDFELSNLICVFSLDVDEQEKKPSGECVAGNRDSTIYSSVQNLFVASAGWRENTPIHQFALATDESKTKYVGSALVNGQVGFADSGGGALDSFAMDEYDGHLRVATTIHNYTNDPEVGFKSNTINALWVLELVQGDPELVGQIDNLAAGERIYTVRFMGKRGFIVTFKKVDPLFAIDLSHPKNPKVRGELKISGFSSYLHPMAEEGYLLAIGKEADPAEYSEDFEWYQGILLSIFDVRDLSDPKLVHKMEIGGRGTDSEALSDHKAFRYVPDEGLVLFPLSLYSESSGGNVYGEYLYSGFHIYRASVAEGFDQVGVSKFPEDGSSYYSYYGNRGRSFYREGLMSMVGGGELVIRSTSSPDSDLARVPAE